MTASEPGCPLNFGHVHQTRRVTLAVEAGIANHVWSMEEIARLSRRKRLQSPPTCVISSTVIEFAKEAWW